MILLNSPYLWHFHFHNETRENPTIALRGVRILMAHICKGKRKTSVASALSVLSVVHQSFLWVRWYHSDSDGEFQRYHFPVRGSLPLYSNVASSNWYLVVTHSCSKLKDFIFHWRIGGVSFIFSQSSGCMLIHNGRRGVSCLLGSYYHCFVITFVVRYILTLAYRFCESDDGKVLRCVFGSWPKNLFGVLPELMFWKP